MRDKANQKYLCTIDVAVNADNEDRISSVRALGTDRKDLEHDEQIG